MAQEKFLQQWIDQGKREFTDPAQYNWCLEGAIDRRDKSLIIEIYDKDMVSWDEEDSLADEMDELVDAANDILYE